MSEFAYKALGSDGRESTGTLTADNRSAAMSQIIDRGLHPLSVEEKNGNGKANGSAAGGLALGQILGRRGGAEITDDSQVGRVSQRSVESFTRELANLLSGGVPLSRALQLLKRESSNASAKYVWGKINDDIVDGKPLAEALGDGPRRSAASMSRWCARARPAASSTSCSARSPSSARASRTCAAR